MHSKKVKMMFRIPDKIDSIRAMDLTKQSNRAGATCYDKNKAVDVRSAASRRRGADKWKIEKKKKPQKKSHIVIANDYGLFDC